MPDSSALDLKELATFDPAFPVEPGSEDQIHRRFSPLLVASDSRRQGASGCVLKAHNTQGEQFALKLAFDAAPGIDTDLLLFEEYRTLTVVSHLKGFPRIYGWGRIDGRPCIVMEWVEGVTLADAKAELVGAGGSTAADGRTVAAVGRAVLRTLCAARALNGGFVHRDLSPRNIMFRTGTHTVAEQRDAGNFDICLIDMGSSSLPAQDSTFTVRAGAWRMGTPAYAPPEMLTCDLPGIERLRDSLAIDVYALGSILYELYAGVGPFQNPLAGAPSAYRVKMDYEPSPLAPAVPRDRPLTEAIMASLAREQKQRIDAEELLRRLESYFDEDGTKTTAPIAVSASHPKTGDALSPASKPPAPVVSAATGTIPTVTAAAPVPAPIRLGARAARRRRWRARLVSIVVILLALAAAIAVTGLVVTALTAR